ncbi:MAG: DUF4854 domain-containing protein [Lachnospiraceae bacterium]|nr:DUF4854 domain-containing protein [Lachnospiraceae bacterium]
MKKKLVALLFAGLLAICLVGCSKPANLEEYFEKPAVKESMDQEVAAQKLANSDTFSDIGYSISGNTFTFTYTSAMQIDNVPLVSSQLDAALTQSSVEPFINDLEDSTGFDDITIQYIYYNNDGSVLLDKSFTN